jgi:hypothetical protein
MLKEDQAWVVQIVKEEIAKIKFPVPETSKPVEVDIDGIVKKVLDKISATTEKVPVIKGKKES